MADGIISVGDNNIQTVVVEYSNFNSQIKKATINVDESLGSTLVVNAIKTTEFDDELNEVDVVKLQVTATDGTNTVELIIDKQATKDLLLITNKIYNSLTE